MSLKHIAIAISTILLLGGCSDSSSGNSGADSLVSTNAYELKDLQDISYKVVKAGNAFTVEGLEEKVILFDIFATWCPPCRASAPNLASLQENYKEQIKIIGILVEDDKPNSYVQEFVDKYGADYSISNSQDNRALSRTIANSIDVGQGFPIPLMVMYYKGKYINHYIGAVPEEMIESDIKRVLKQ
ncbi:MAG: TlpA family protein disulfide reductase [Campylobacterales bacterium]|nr:TlpA family protein disulfide reductase [Campylobacterales bacterium]